MSGIRLNLVDTEESTMLDGSTAQTTPEGSISQEFSPVMRPLVRPVDGDATGARAANGAAAVSAQSPVIRTICCVGAGYVGTSFFPFLFFFVFLLCPCRLERACSSLFLHLPVLLLL